jgi:hypothetical protein
MLTPGGSQVEMSKETDSERIFEKYLESQGVAYERLPELPEKQPDYRVQYGDLACVFEVKQFDEPPDRPNGKYPITEPIRRRISDARTQFGRYENCCCSLVLWNNSIRRSAETTSVLRAAFGGWVDFPDPLSKQPPAYEFSGRDAALTSSKNTRVSAIVILTSYELNRMQVEVWKELSARKERGEQVEIFDYFELLNTLPTNYSGEASHSGTIRTIVIENPHAKIAFPPGLFVGPFDQRWRMQPARFQLAFLGCELERLKAEGVPYAHL